MYPSIMVRSVVDFNTMMAIHTNTHTHNCHACRWHTDDTRYASSCQGSRGASEQGSSFRR